MALQTLDALQRWRRWLRQQCRPARAVERSSGGDAHQGVGGVYKGHGCGVERAEMWAEVWAARRTARRRAAAARAAAAVRSQRGGTQASPPRTSGRAASSSRRSLQPASPGMQQPREGRQRKGGVGSARSTAWPRGCRRSHSARPAKVGLRHMAPAIRGQGAQ
eukprot:scaffold76033_cov56-Phaeocystis_antarctica.AAC.2